jgi:hypothetical protein
MPYNYIQFPVELLRKSELKEWILLVCARSKNLLRANRTIGSRGTHFRNNSTGNCICPLISRLGKATSTSCVPSGLFVCSDSGQVHLHIRVFSLRELNRKSSRLDRKSSCFRKRLAVVQPTRCAGLFVEVLDFLSNYCS